MRAKLTASGIPSEFGGKHNNHATEMASISFPDGSYLEVIAIQPDADPAAVNAHYWAKQMQNNIGPCAWAVRVNDLGAEASALAKNGVEVSKPMASGRTRPDGARLDWKTARVGLEPQGTFFPFLIQDLTDRALRAFPKGTPASKDYQGIAHVVIAVRDLKASKAARYQKAFQLSETRSRNRLQMGREACQVRRNSGNSGGGADGKNSLRGRRASRVHSVEKWNRKNHHVVRSGKIGVETWRRIKRAARRKPFGRFSRRAGR